MAQLSREASRAQGFVFFLAAMLGLVIAQLIAFELHLPVHHSNTATPSKAKLDFTYSQWLDGLRHDLELLAQL